MRCLRWLLAAVLFVSFFDDARSGHLGSPEEVSGSILTSVSLEQLAAILSPHGYSFSGENHGGWHFVTPNGRNMFLNLYACGGINAACSESMPIGSSPGVTRPSWELVALNNWFRVHPCRLFPSRVVRSR